MNRLPHRYQVAAYCLAIVAGFAARPALAAPRRHIQSSTTTVSALQFVGAIESITGGVGAVITTINVKGHQPPTSTTHVRERVEGRNGERPRTIERASAKGATGTELRSFRIDPLCRVHFAGKDTGTVGELKVGDRVVIAYKADLGGEFSATDIEASSGEHKSPQEKGHKK